MPEIRIDPRGQRTVAGIDGFETMVAYTAPAFWLFFMLTGTALFPLRRQAPANPDPFRVPFYPVTPLLFAGACAFMLYSSFNYAMSLDPGSIGAMVGMAMIASGIPLLMWAKRIAAASGRA